MERLLTEGLRSLSDLLKKMADLVEQRRLARGGYKQPEQFLERSDRPSATGTPLKPSGAEGSGQR